MMSPDTLVTLAAVLCSGGLAAALFLRKRRTIAGWCFCAGMSGLAVEGLLGIAALRAANLETAAFWFNLSFVTKSLLAAIWLSFSLTYSRGNFREFLRRWRFILVAAFLFPPVLLIGFPNAVVRVSQSAEGVSFLSLSPIGTALNILLLMAAVIILANLEKTFRAAIGTMRWRIKLVVLGLGVEFGTRIYTRTQSLLYPGLDLSSIGIESIALLIGCGFIAVAYRRTGLAEIDVYPSHAVLGTSVTVLLTGIYLFTVGVLAQVIARMGGTASFPLQAFLILVGIASLAMLLLSDRLRERLGRFVSRHFKRPQHDSRRIWTALTHRTADVMDRAVLCDVTARLISETFNTLTVTVWLIDEDHRRLVSVASTSDAPPVNAEVDTLSSIHDEMTSRLEAARLPFDLEAAGEWAESLRRLNAPHFKAGSPRIGVPLIAREKALGVIILADRVNDTPYSLEEMDLLKCIGEQCAARLLNLRLNEALVRAREFEAFQTMSAFFVHDLKNAASTLSLMLNNLPVHFADPAFREDALRGIGRTVTRINQLIERIGVLRRELELRPSECDLPRLVLEAIEQLPRMPNVEVVKELRPVAPVMADREGMLSVFTNLLLNAADAIGPGGGRVTVETSQHDSVAVFSVSDTGCGMTPDFLRESLFRPFRTTKKKGLGIGMFQSKMIVEAHRGSVEVESEPGRGTTFRVLLPAKPAAKPSSHDHEAAQPLLTGEAR